MTFVKNDRHTDIFVIDPQSPNVSYVTEKKCRDCRRTLLASDFHRRRAGDGMMSRCIKCYETYWMQWNDRRSQWPVDTFLAQKVQQANVRSRYRRSVGKALTLCEATRAWTKCAGRCENCTTPLTFAWTPRRLNPDHAIIDRVNTAANKTYAGNMAWLCNACNREKSGWDILHQRDHELAAVKAELHSARGEIRDLRNQVARLTTKKDAPARNSPTPDLRD